MRRPHIQMPHMHKNTKRTINLFFLFKFFLFFSVLIVNNLMLCACCSFSLKPSLKYGFFMLLPIDLFSKPPKLLLPV